MRTIVAGSRKMYRIAIILSCVFTAIFVYLPSVALALDIHVKTHMELIGAIAYYPTGTIFHLDNDLDAITSASFTTAKNVTIDGHGHAIRGDGINDSYLYFSGNVAGYIITLRNLIMENLVNNSRQYGGGAIGVRRGAGSLTIENCAFIGNKYLSSNASASYGGGAVVVGSNNTTLTVRNSTFYGNESISGGGAIFLGGSSTSTANGVIENCTIVGNRAVGGGGIGVTAGGNTSFTLANNIIAGNDATNQGYGGDVHIVIASTGDGFVDSGNNLLGDAQGSNKSGQIVFDDSTETGVYVAEFLAEGPPVVDEEAVPNPIPAIALKAVLNSLALDKIDTLYAPEFDQRGLGRYGLADIGAYELQAPEITVGVQSGNLTAGIAGSVTYKVATKRMAAETPIDLINEGTVEGISLEGLPEAEDGGITTVTINTTAETPQGTHALKLDFDGVESDSFNIVVNPPYTGGGGSSGGSSSGGGGSGGGSSGTGSTETSDGTDTPVVVDNSDAQTPAVVVTLPENSVVFDVSTGMETVTVPVGTLADAIQQAVQVATETGGTVPTLEIKAEATQTSGVSAVNVVMPVTDLEAVASSGVNVKVVSVVGEVTLDAAAIRKLTAETAGTATAGLVIEHMGTGGILGEDLSEAQESVLRGENVREVYDISLYAGDKKLENFEASSLSGKLTVGLPYALETGEVDAGVWVVHVGYDGSTQRMTEGRKYERGLAVFKTSHLSVYAVTYEAENVSGAGEESSSSGGCDTGAAGAVILAASAFALTRKGRNKA
ncbi:MAG: right-handed parallel beta-helix repeat-containing protein [Synergistaceae bacterium]|nr:right-handed parallel beta-helix repeat-containing protein [Synergistaceae bacterium]